MPPRVLIVEDDPFIAFDLSERLARAGFSVIGEASNSRQGVTLATDVGCDIAVLDVNLGTETSAPVAQELIRRGIPFVTVSGYSRDQHPPVFNGAPVLEKPIRIERLVAELKRLLKD
jgi:DNA-binding response OmpR family regulator